MFQKEKGLHFNHFQKNLTWVLPPLASRTALLAKAPQLTNDWKKELHTFAAPSAKSS